jgi:hypothetical protein
MLFAAEFGERSFLNGVSLAEMLFTHLASLDVLLTQQPATIFTDSVDFGMSKHNLVVEIEDGMVKGKEVRPNIFHQPERGTAHHTDHEDSSHDEML